METPSINWQQIRDELEKPFKSGEIRFRLEGRVRRDGKKCYVRAIPFVAAYAVKARLAQAVGIENWSFRWTPVALNKGRVVTAKGTLSLYGCLPKEEEGRDQKGGEPGETVAADALRNCAALFGVGQYLCELNEQDLEIEVPSPDPNHWEIPQAEIVRLRAMLPHPVDGALATGEGTLVASAVQAEEPGEGSADEKGAEEGESVQELVGAGEIEKALTSGASEPVVEAVESGEETADELGSHEDPSEDAELEKELAAYEEGIAFEEEELAEEAVEEEEVEDPGFVAEELAEGEYASDGLEEPPSEAETEGTASDEMAEDAVESAPQVEAQVHPEKVQAIRRLVSELGKPEPEGLIEMAADQAEKELARLTAAWGVQQRAASAPKQPANHRTPVNTEGEEIAQASNDLWSEYEDLCALLGRKVPDQRARQYLRAQTVAKMIDQLRTEADRRTRPQAEMAHTGR